MFFESQSNKNKELYMELLKVTASLSNLFSESKNPFLYYRAMENIFCKSFDAENLSRSDVSADASKASIGIGLKTFLHENGKTYQKIAEFNSESYLIRDLKEKDTVYKVAEMRNKRIDVTKDICNLDDMIYHVITRENSKLNIYEEHMDYIDINNLRIKDTGGKNNIHFVDGENEYNFSLSKNTLFKRFDTSNIELVKELKVKILEDPFEYLLNQTNILIDGEYEDESNKIIDYIILPLYSPTSNRVERKSGLNSWNAGGRQRHSDEVYIPIPSWIHKYKEDFFEYITEDNRTDSFDVILPNKKTLSMKVVQQGGKALQSNPNKALGSWILRDVLKIKKDTVVTKADLDEKGIDSIKLSKDEEGVYYMDFLKVGSFEEYKNRMLYI